MPNVQKKATDCAVKRDDETTSTAFDPTKGKFVNPRTGEVVDDPEDESVAEVAKKVEDVKV